MTGIADLFVERAIVPVSVNGTTCHVRELSGTEIYEVYESAEKKGTELVVQLLARSVCDEGGRPLATEAEIRKLPKVWIDAFFEAAAPLNGVGDSAKKSKAVQNSDSS